MRAASILIAVVAILADSRTDFAASRKVDDKAASTRAKSIEKKLVVGQFRPSIPAASCFLSPSRVAAASRRARMTIQEFKPTQYLENCRICIALPIDYACVRVSV
jgi:hypothetical protein